MPEPTITYEKFCYCKPVVLDEDEVCTLCGKQWVRSGA